MNILRRITLPFRYRCLVRRMEGERKWYPCYCQECGWVGSSCGLEVDYSYYSEDSEVYCPECGSDKIES